MSLLLPLIATTDTAGGVGIPVALAAGLVSFLSPCVLPLVPGYLSTVIGVAPARHRGVRARAGCWCRACCSSRASRSIFILLGLGATAIGSTLNEHKQTLEQVGGVVIVAMGDRVPGDAVRATAQPPVALRVAAAPRRARRAAGRGGGVRDRLDAVHEHHARRDPHPGGGLELGRAWGAAAGLLLGGPGDPVPADRARVRAR